MILLNKTVASFHFNQIILILAVGAMFSSCYENKKQQTTSQDTLLPPKVTVLANLPDSIKPTETFLENSTQPLTVLIPATKGGSYITQNPGGPVRIQLLPAMTHTFVDPVTHLPVLPEVQGTGFFTTYATDKGLALDAILCSTEDKKGNLWFGTAGGGVSRYDGKYFVNYTGAQGLAYNTVNCITEDKNGNLWFGTGGGGVSKFDGRIFVNYTSADGLANNSVTSIAEDKSGNLWIGTAGGVSRYDGNSFVNYTTSQGLANNTVWSILADKTGNLWFSTSGGVSKYDGKSFVNFTTVQGLAINRVLCSIQDKAGNFWFGLDGGGISMYDGKTFVNYDAAQGLAGNKVVSITQDKTGNLWFGTYGGGVSKYDGKSFVNFTITQGLAGNVVASITEDRTGKLWFGIYGGGVSRYSGKSFVNYTTAQGLANNVVRSIAEDKSGNLWFGTNGGGVSKYGGESFVNFTTSQGLANNLGYSIAEDKAGNLWIGTFGGGLSKYDGKTFVNYTKAHGLASNLIQCISEDEAGNLWIGTNGGGVSKYTGKSFVNFSTLQGLGDNSVQCITQDKVGNIWFGTNSGVTFYDGKSFANYSTLQGLPNDIVNCITEDETGNIWIGTEEGLSLLRVKNIHRIADSSLRTQIGSRQLFENITTQNGLPDNYVTQVIQGDDKKLYAGTNLGICELLQVKKSGANQVEWTVGRIFNTQTGYPVKDVNAGQNTMFKDSKGIIWIATGSDKTGLVRFDPLEVRSESKPASLVIQSIKINNESISWHDLLLASHGEQAEAMSGINKTKPNITEEVTTFGRELSEAERSSMHQKFGDIQFDGISKWYNLPENLVLPHQHNNISFDFSAINPGSSSLTKYQYMLEGYDKSWSPASNVSTASFGNIYEGTYTFRLKALNDSGISEVPVSYAFRVLPPWWRTWWMYIIYLLTFLAALRIFSKWRERRIVDEKEKLEKKVEHRTEELNHSLKELKATQSLLIQAEKMASLGELTAGIAHEIQNPLNFVTNFSEVSGELLDEMDGELDKGDIDEAKAIAADVRLNLEKINQHGKRAANIVKGMLQHSRTSSGQKELTDINTLADEYLRLAYHGLRAKDKSFNAGFKIELDEALPKISVIPQDIGRVLLNLINNAFYAVSEKQKSDIAGYEPTVSISTSLSISKSEKSTSLLLEENVPEGRMRYGEGRGEVKIIVSDNGNGIPQKVLDKIFQPFFTTKPAGQGTGLGLSMSYDIIKVHGGELKVETREGQGTAFIVSLPFS